MIKSPIPSPSPSAIKLPPETVPSVDSIVTLSAPVMLLTIESATDVIPTFLPEPPSMSALPPDLIIKSPTPLPSASATKSVPLTSLPAEITILVSAFTLSIVTEPFLDVNEPLPVVSSFDFLIVISPVFKLPVELITTFSTVSGVTFKSVLPASALILITDVSIVIFKSPLSVADLISIASASKIFLPTADSKLSLETVFCIASKYSDELFITLPSSAAM